MGNEYQLPAVVLGLVEELKYLGVLFISESKIEGEVDRQIDGASAVMMSY